MSQENEKSEVEANIDSLYEMVKGLSDRLSVTEATVDELKQASDLEKENELEVEELYDEAKEIVLEAGKASTSYLQRKMRIGYSKSARLMDMLEEEGVVGPADYGSTTPRKVFLE